MNLADVPKEKLSPGMRQYADLKEKYQDCILFFRVGDFYEMFFEDAILVSRELELTLTPQWSTRKTIFGEDEKAWLIGIGPLGSVRVEELGFSEALKTGLVQTWRLVDLTWQSFVKLAQRVVPADQVGGPIMIAQMVGQQAEQGLVGVLGLAALISINLAILNLLPVPVLDGGQMLFCLIEMIFRRPVPQKIQEWGMRVGMALLLSLMIFATFNDVTRIINTPDEAPAVEKTAP